MSIHLSSSKLTLSEKLDIRKDIIASGSYETRILIDDNNLEYGKQYSDKYLELSGVTNISRVDQKTDEKREYETRYEIPNIKPQFISSLILKSLRFNAAVQIQRIAKIQATGNQELIDFDIYSGFLILTKPNNFDALYSLADLLSREIVIATPDELKDGIVRSAPTNVRLENLWANFGSLTDS